MEVSYVCHLCLNWLPQGTNTGGTLSTLVARVRASSDPTDAAYVIYIFDNKKN